MCVLRWRIPVNCPHLLRGEIFNEEGGSKLWRGGNYWRRRRREIRLSRIKRAIWKGRNPRPGLALCMLSQTAVSAATTVTGSAVVPVTLKC
jgi:hypothetical protein